MVTMVPVVVVVVSRIRHVVVHMFDMGGPRMDEGDDHRSSQKTRSVSQRIFGENTEHFNPGRYINASGEISPGMSDVTVRNRVILYIVRFWPEELR